MALIMAAVMATAVVGCGSGDNKDSGTQGASNEDEMCIRDRVYWG